MAAPLYTFTVRDPATIRGDFLRFWKVAMQARGVANPNVTQGGDAWIDATRLSNECAVVEANAVLKADSLLPDTAGGADLYRIGVMFGVTPRDAVGSAGNLSYSASAAQYIAAGTALVDKLGQVFEVVTGQVYSPLDLIALQATSTGSATNHAAGDTLTWQSAPTYAQPVQVVATGGLTGGADAEIDDVYRARIIATLANYPASGNWQFVAVLAADSSPTVQQAFVYPAARGGATLNVAVAGYPQTTGALSSTSKNRDIDATTLTNTITPYIKGLMPEHTDIEVATVVNQPIDVSFGLTLPAASTASPPGPGGGWVDGTPWPALSGTGFTVACVLSTGTSPASAADPTSTTFTVYAPTLPAVGTSIAWLSPLTWTVYTGVITAASTVASNQRQVTVSTPFVGIAAGNYVFPAAVATQSYVDATLKAFGLMGPGEVTTDGNLIGRAFRHPAPQQSWPYTMTGTQLRALSNVGQEVLDVSYLYKSATTPTINAMPTGPSQFTPRNLGFYPI